MQLCWRPIASYKPVLSTGVNEYLFDFGGEYRCREFGTGSPSAGTTASSHLFHCDVNTDYQQRQAQAIQDVQAKVKGPRHLKYCS